jgi:hypothetical protein
VRLAAYRVTAAVAAGPLAGDLNAVPPIDVSRALSLDEWDAYVREETRRLTTAGVSPVDRLTALATEIRGAFAALGAPDRVGHMLGHELAPLGEATAGPAPLARAESLAAVVRYLPTAGPAALGHVMTHVMPHVMTHALASPPHVAAPALLGPRVLALVAALPVRGLEARAPIAERVRAALGALTGPSRQTVREAQGQLAAARSASAREPARESASEPAPRPTPGLPPVAPAAATLPIGAAVPAVLTLADRASAMFARAGGRGATPGMPIARTGAMQQLIATTLGLVLTARLPLLAPLLDTAGLAALAGALRRAADPTRSRARGASLVAAARAGTASSAGPA